MKFWHFLVGGTVLALFATAVDAETLSLSSYLEQVQKQNEGVKSSALSSEGAKLRSHEGDLLTSFNLFANASYAEDQRIQAIQFGARTTTAQAQLGISKLTDFGLQARLYQQVTSTSIYGINPLFTSLGLPSGYFDSGPSLELTQSLWRNGFGSETRAQKEVADAAAGFTQYDQSYKTKKSLSDAETSYWQLALARQLVSIQKETLSRARQIREWSARRAQNDLADKADLLQADAAYRLQELQLRSAENDARAAARAFNSNRGVDSDDLSETLDVLQDQQIDSLPVPPRAKLRDDVKAAQQTEKLSYANAALGRDKNSPTLDVYANLSVMGHDPAFGNTLDQVSTYNHPYTLVGLKFSAPLDFSLIKEDRAGYAKDQNAAELLVSRKLFEQESEWKDLLQKFDEAKQRLSLAREIESAQRLKVEHEKERFRRAKTTTYQVLQFETDYNSARVSHLRIANEILSLVARMKTFGGSDESR